MSNSVTWDSLSKCEPRYQTLRAYSKVVCFLPTHTNSQFYELKSHVIQALLEINGKTCNVQIPSDESSESSDPSHDKELNSIVDRLAENLCRVFNSNQGSYHSPVQMPNYLVTGDIPLGDHQEATEVSRFAMAWWQDPQETLRVRLFGDRIKLNVPLPLIPRLFSFGINNYNLVYPDSQCDPHHCTRCNQKFNLLQDFKSFCFIPENVDDVHFLENPHCFLCCDCKYLYDTGFLPGSASKKSQIAARRSSN